MGATSQHFSDSELACKCGCGQNNATEALVDLLENIRSIAENIYGIGRVRIIVNSATRCDNHNAKIGGAKTSQHLLGNAADIRIQISLDRARGHQWVTLTIQEMEIVARKSKKLRGIGVDPFEQYIHVDARPAEVLAQWSYDRAGKTVPYVASQAVES